MLTNEFLESKPLGIDDDQIETVAYDDFTNGILKQWEKVPVEETYLVKNSLDNLDLYTNGPDNQISKERQSKTEE